MEELFSFSRRIKMIKIILTILIIIATWADTTHCIPPVPVGFGLTEADKGVANGVASLDANSKVVQNPANATATPEGSKIPIADINGKLHSDWLPSGTAHARLHNIDGTLDHTGIAGATQNNFMGIDANGLPKDSGSKASDFITVGTTTAGISDSLNKRYVTDAQLTILGNTSGTNTGDQDLSGYVPTSRTINGHDLTLNVTISKSDIGLGNSDNTSDLNKPVSNATQTALDNKVDENVSIIGATKTKLTYDSKGLITAGTDATTTDISDSLNKRYVTDAQLTILGNTSGTNTGDETQVTIKTKLGVASAGVDGYTSGYDWSTFNGKQNALGFTPENSANKAQASGYASLDANSKVVQNPANATATPEGSKIPIADITGKLDSWITGGSGVTNGDLHNHLDGDGGTIAYSSLSGIPSTFTPSSHNNTSHSETYILSTGVTYETLDANGDIGSGIGQVAIGNHTHNYATNLADPNINAIRIWDDTDNAELFAIIGGGLSYDPGTNTLSATGSAPTFDQIGNGTSTSKTFTIGTGSSLSYSNTGTINATTLETHAASYFEPANANIQSHIVNTSNPHSVTKTQVSLGNVDNVQQLPISYLDTDGALSANSDVKVASQKATKTYADTKVIGPATNTDSYVPQWNGLNSKTLKDGLLVATTVGNPGVDTSVVTEQGIREALDLKQAADADLTTLAALGNWKIAYTNGSGAQTALALGAAGTVLKSAGATSAPTFTTPITGWYDVTDYGADPTGVADSTTAFNAVNTAVPSGGYTGAVMWVPPGTYLINGTVTITKNIRIIGGGRTATLIGTADTTNTIFEITLSASGASRASIEHMTIHVGFGNTSRTLTSALIDVNAPIPDTNEVSFKYLDLFDANDPGHGIGIKYTTLWGSSTIDSVWTHRMSTGVYLGNSESSDAGRIAIVNSTFQEATFGIYQRNTGDNTYANNAFVWDTYSIYLNMETVSVNYSGAMQVVGNVFDGGGLTTQAHITLTTATGAEYYTGIAITGNNFYFGDKGVVINGVNLLAVSITGNGFMTETAVQGGSYGIDIIAVNGVNIDGNQFWNSPTAIHVTNSANVVGVGIGTNFFDSTIITKVDDAGDKATTDLAVAGSWKSIYTNSNGNVQGVALGAAGTVLKSTGVSSAPTFSKPVSGWFDVTDYGAVIGDTLDDAAAFTAAIAAMSTGDTLWVPPGIGAYFFGTTVVVNKSITIMSGIAWDYDTTYGMIRPLSTLASPYMLFDVTATDQVQFKNIGFYSLDQLGAYMYNTTAIHVDNDGVASTESHRFENCYFLQFQYGIDINRATGFVVENCRFRSVASQPAGAYSYGIRTDNDVDPDHGDFYVVNSSFTCETINNYYGIYQQGGGGIILDGCKMKGEGSNNYGYYNDSTTVSGHNWSDFKIVDNSIEVNTSAIVFTGVNTEDGINVDNITISGNQIASYYPIILNYKNTHVSGDERLAHVDISGNLMRGAYPLVAGVGITIGGAGDSDVSNVHIDGNIIADHTYGISVANEATVTYITVGTNNFYNCGTNILDAGSKITFNLGGVTTVSTTEFGYLDGVTSAIQTQLNGKASSSQGVTNGDSHDHSGGDGAQIAYSTLSGLPTLGTMASQNSNNVSITDGSISGLNGLTWDTNQTVGFSTISGTNKYSLGDINNYLSISTGSYTTMASYHGTLFSNATGTVARIGALSSNLESYFMGNIGIGDTDPDHALDVNGNIRLQGTDYIYFGGTGPADAVITMRYGGGTTLDINVSPKFLNLTGSGNDYVCINSAGEIYRSDAGCS